MSPYLFGVDGYMVGVVAQLVEHHNGIVGVAGSIPVGSTILQGQGTIPINCAELSLASSSKQSRLVLKSEQFFYTPSPALQLVGNQLGARKRFNPHRWGKASSFGVQTRLFPKPGHQR
jgi:hypothetical protein